MAKQLLSLSRISFLILLSACSKGDILAVECNHNEGHYKSMGWSLTCRSMDPHPSYIVASCYKDKSCDVYQGMIAQALGAKRSNLSNNLKVSRKISEGNGWLGREPFGLDMRAKTCGAFLTVSKQGEKLDSAKTLTKFGCYDDKNENSTPDYLD